jgi:hypothetical protein
MFQVTIQVNKAEILLKCFLLPIVDRGIPPINVYISESNPTRILKIHKTFI